MEEKNIKYPTKYISFADFKDRTIFLERLPSNDEIESAEKNGNLIVCYFVDGDSNAVLKRERELKDLKSSSYVHIFYGFKTFDDFKKWYLFICDDKNFKEWYAPAGVNRRKDG